MLTQPTQSIPEPCRPDQRTRALPTWPVLALFAWFPLWWLVGLGGFIPILLAVPMALNLVLDRRALIPPGLWLWGLFLTWVLVSGSQVPDGDSALVFAYRYSLYVSAGVTYAYVYNLCRQRAARSLVVQSMAALWVAIVVGGFIALVLPGLQFTSPFERGLPGAALGNEWLRDMVHPRIAEGGSKRPTGPFTYTNEWGANFALLMPLALLAVLHRRRPTMRWPLLVVLSVAPLLLSTNRGAWLSIGAGLVYSLTLLRGQAKVHGVVATMLVFAVVAAVFVATGVSQRVDQSLDSRESTETRASIYQQTFDAAGESPWIGYGGPRPSKFDSQPPLGTHGQLWMTMYSHGFPATALYVVFLFYLLFRSRRARSPLAVAANMVLAITIVQLPFYGALPMQLFVTMTAAGLAMAELHSADETPA